MKSVTIIPVRMGSSRFPGKPLKKISGIPLVAHCYYRAKKSKMVKDVFIATCDKEIEDVCNKFGAKVIMTSKKHTRASDRTAEALLKIEKKNNLKIKNIIMLQGDEPLIYPKNIDLTYKYLLDKKINVTNCIYPLKNFKEEKNTNIIKVVFDTNMNALYFSRNGIPYSKKNVSSYKQVCVIGFKRKALLDFNKMKETKNEILESIDMLRLLDNGLNVKLIKIDNFTHGVDNISDRNLVSKIMKKDKLFKSYEIKSKLF